jgi:hypothetical protein
MTELLALPGWNVPPTPLSAWVEQFQKQGLAVEAVRESTGVSWVELRALRLRGYAVMQGLCAEAINFELAAPEPAPARQAVETAAAALGWELHDDEDDEDNDDED